MAVNQSHTENRQGVFIPFGDSVLTHYQDVDLSFPQQPERCNLFSGTKKGTVFLTSYRVIFMTSHLVSDPMLSFMMPFDLMSNCAIEQPVFAANYIKGTIQAASDGGWEGQATFKLTFRKGGAIEFAQLMMKAASAAARGVPLGSMNYWFSPPGLYVVTGQGNMMCTQQMPCPGGIRTPTGWIRTPTGWIRTPTGWIWTPTGWIRTPAGGIWIPIRGIQTPTCGIWSPTRGIQSPTSWKRNLTYWK
ncbi:postacrosomal sheath WW domain-binding protein isoform X2 [Hyaena hyaena]|uniref:postacrosomal sheath WW domain-binding protein isoform X2 n=1 Tax=Hyaena hyaena TaxID=95912 RepID=UPI001923339E|nr:postacrosomal sheath WW domain-binding protein isoform X2 [Hyaena hyaena]